MYQQQRYIKSTHSESFSPQATPNEYSPQMADKPIMEIQIDSKEYGMMNAERHQRFEIRPIEMTVDERYVDYFELYNEQLSSTKIVLVKDMVEERVSILTFAFRILSSWSQEVMGWMNTWIMSHTYY